MRFIRGAGSVKARGLNQSEAIGYSIAETPIFTGETSAANSTPDMNYLDVTAAGLVNNCRIIANNANARFVSLHPTIGVVDSTGNVTRVSTGTATIEVSAPGAGAQRFTRQMAVASGTFSRFVAYKAGSLGAHCQAQVEALIAGKTPGDTRQRYWATNDGTTGIRNTSNFAASLDLSAMSMRVGTYPDERFPACLVSSRHALVASHVAPANGASVVFQRSNGTYQTVTILAQTNIANLDLSVVYLSAAITGIAPFKTMPLNWEATYAPSLRPSIPVNAAIAQVQKTIAGTAGGYLSVRNVSFSGPVLGTSPLIYSLMQSRAAQATMLPWDRAVQGGDSGSPALLSINGSPILLCMQTGADGGTPVSYYTALINTTMNTQAGTSGVFTLEHPSLAGFNTY